MNAIIFSFAIVLVTRPFVTVSFCYELIEHHNGFLCQTASTRFTRFQPVADVVNHTLSHWSEYGAP